MDPLQTQAGRVAEGRPTTKAKELGQRTCVVCRQERQQDQFLRVYAMDGALAFGRAGSGRGAYVCVAHACLSGLHTKNLSRALKTEIKSTEDALWLTQICDLAHARVLQALGLARRSNVLLSGVEKVRSALKSELAACAVVAEDASASTHRDFGDRAYSFADAAQLGAATGQKDVSILALPSGHFAKEAVYWLQVWYEARGRTPTILPAAQSKGGNCHE